MGGKEINSKFENPYIVRCILVGTHNVGKSTLANVYDTGKFDPNIASTIGIAFVSKIVTLANYNNHRVKLQVWDTAGQERFKSIVRQYLRDTYIAFIVFDVTNRKSWEMVDKWRDELLEEKEYESTPLIVLVGTKADLMINAEVYPNEVEEKAKEWGCKHYIISSKFSNSDSSINRIFTLAAEDLHKKLLDDHYSGIPIPPKVYKSKSFFSDDETPIKNSFCCYQ